MLMRKLFLSSYFKEVSHLFEDFVSEDLKGKTVTFIPTASLVEKFKFYVETGRKALKKMGLTIDELEISTATYEEISKKLQQNDYIYVSGGNTFFLLQELKRTGSDKIIIEQVNLGKLYIGESAGSVVVAPNIEFVKDIDNYQKAPDLNSFNSLGLVDFYVVPHYTNFPFKKVTRKVISKYEDDLLLQPISNAQAILVSDDIKVVTK